MNQDSNGMVPQVMVDHAAKDRNSCREDTRTAIKAMFVCTLVIAISGVSLEANLCHAQQQTATPQNAGQQALAQRTPAQQAPAQQPGGRPFAPLGAQEQGRLDQLLLAWQQQSQAMKTLECNFERWEYDAQGAPAGMHWKKATGTIKYANPDKGLFLDETVNVYQGMKEGKPQYGPSPQVQGDYWVCTGKEVHSYDRSEKKCTILELPANMQGTQIFNSPLPFVFNLDAQEIKQRYWVRTMPVKDASTYLIEAWPKTQQDRAQYKLVQVALNQDFEPIALVMYAPNFHPKFAPEWDHYQFTNVKRNAIGSGFQQFFGNFVPKRVPMGWKVEREKMSQEQVAQQPAATGPQRQ